MSTDEIFGLLFSFHKQSSPCNRYQNWQAVQWTQSTFCLESIIVALRILAMHDFLVVLMTKGQRHPSFNPLSADFRDTRVRYWTFHIFTIVYPIPHMIDHPIIASILNTPYKVFWVCLLEEEDVACSFITQVIKYIEMALQHISGHDGSMCNADQRRSMYDKISSTDTNVARALPKKLPGIPKCQVQWLG